MSGSAVAPPRRWKRLALSVSCGLVLMLLGVASAAAGALVALPAVGNAGLRARHIAAQHHETADWPLPRRLALAAIASEDGEFREPVVINVALGAVRAAAALVQGNANPGGATIDQQLAKALYGQGEGIAGTLRQIGLGIKLGLQRMIADGVLSTAQAHDAYASPLSLRGQSQR